MLHDGLYEQVMNRKLEDELSKTDKVSELTDIDAAEASKILAKYVSEVVQKGLENVADNGGDVFAQVELINRIIKTVVDGTHETDFIEMSVSERAKELLSLFDPKNSILALDPKAKIVRPETSIAESSLFTGAVREPQMFTELKKEILSCDRIDMLVSFIKWSGLRLILDELKAFTAKGGKLRIITTSYMGATDVKAVEELSLLANTQIKVSYDTKRTRLHAKTYVFYRDSGFTTAYVGSSNLSNAAISSGLEWNVKVTKKDLPETIDKIAATFESYWNSNEFEIYDSSKKGKLEQALKAEKYVSEGNSQIYTMDITPYPYQQEILDRLEAERTIRGQYRNLVVAATGTGKTVISALDYKRFRKQNPKSPCRLLFVAHREEILRQSISTFRAVLKDANFGELFVGNTRPESLDNLFISIQTFNSQDFTTKTSEDFYDFIIVDEFHHAAAPTYQKLLSYYKPKILLGLTATPERMDGKSILPYFNNRIAAEIRLPEAIDRKLLCPFQYFGLTDNIDLDQLKWAAGGYDKNELSRLYVSSGKQSTSRADLVVASLMKYVTDINDVKGLGFCVSVEHAEFMAEYFNHCNIPSIALSGLSGDEERKNAKKRLVDGDIRFIFVVDIYNEGVDIPEVNTVLFLRPTESLTVFLQQLGRGLRLSENKDCLTVLDFIGQANKHYNFESRFSALLSSNNRGVLSEMKSGFVSLPKGCFIQLEKKAAKYILDNIRASYGNSAGLISRIASFHTDTGLTLTLSAFLDYYHMDSRAIYKFSSFSRLCARAEVIPDFHEPLEETITKALCRFASVDSRRWIRFMIDMLKHISDFDSGKLSDLERRMVQMFYATLWGKGIEDFESEEVKNQFKMLQESSVMVSEIISLLQYNYNRIDFLDAPVDVGFDCPLDLHCTYTRDQLLLAMDFLKPNTVREGVKWLGDKKLDVFFITLNKSDKEYSPSTMYQDYSVNETLFHWQSQSTTNEDGKVGQRYIHHKELGSRVLLFVREFKTDDFGNAGAYTFLGTAEYVSHTGSRPMSINWKLDAPIPAKYLKKTNKLMGS